MSGHASKTTWGSGQGPPTGARVVATASGLLGIVVRGDILRRVWLPRSATALSEALQAEFPGVPETGEGETLDRVGAALRAYFDGDPIDPGSLDVPLDPGTEAPFTRRVYAALRRVPRGETVSYGELAEEVGSPGAARAVGQAMAKNPLPLVIPCHRVLGRSGALTGFSSVGGTDAKSRLLRLERGVPAQGDMVQALFWP